MPPVPARRLSSGALSLPDPESVDDNSESPDFAPHAGISHTHPRSAPNLARQYGKLHVTSPRFDDSRPGFQSGIQLKRSIVEDRCSVRTQRAAPASCISKNERSRSRPGQGVSTGHTRGRRRRESRPRPPGTDPACDHGRGRSATRERSTSLESAKLFATWRPRSTGAIYRRPSSVYSRGAAEAIPNHFARLRTLFARDATVSPSHTEERQPIS